MGWTRYLDYENLRFVVESGAYMSKIPSEVVGLFIRDQQTIQAIRSYDKRILDMLNFMIDEIEELSLSTWATDTYAFEHWREEKSLDEYEQSLYKILNGKYADDETKEKIKAEFGWIEARRQQSAEKIAKRTHSRRRRSQFAKNYDQFMLALIHRDGYKCAVCGVIEDLSIDHIVPLSKGGSDDIDNLRILCRTHNSSKSDK